MGITWRITIPYIRKLSGSTTRQGSNKAGLLPSLYAQTTCGIGTQCRRAPCCCDERGERRHRRSSCQRDPWMAFQPPGIGKVCTVCESVTFAYRLFRSHRKVHEEYDQEGSLRQYRLCAICEYEYRVREASDWDACPEDERSSDPDYATRASVARDIRRQSRSQQWLQTGMAMKKAKAQVREEREMEAAMPADMPRINQVVLVPGPGAGIGGGRKGTSSDALSVTSSLSSMSGKDRRQLIMRRSKSMAESLVLSLLQCNMTYDAFEVAGLRSIEAAEATERLATRISPGMRYDTR